MLGDILKLNPVVVLNNLKYCVVHARDICHECSRVCATENETKRGFKLPESQIPQYPDLLNYKRDPKIRNQIGNRWLEMQKILYPGLSETLAASMIKLPVNENPDEVCASGVCLQKKLLHVFHQLQGLTATQRYYFGNQSRIMIEDYDTFMGAAVLYEEELADMTARMLQIFDMTGGEPGSREREAQAKSNILNKFAFFLELNTHRTFWRAMEMTADAFVMHTEHYEEEADSHVVFTEKAKMHLLQWLANMFWSVQHAQFRLNRLRALQHEVFQRSEFPHYPVVLSALEADLDVHVIIAKLAKSGLHDLPSFASLFMELRKASEYPEQMRFVNAEIMAAIDELSARFRVLENLISAAQLVASEEDIRAALLTYKFLPDGKDVNSRVDDVMALIYMIHEVRQPTSKKCSYLQKLIVKENTFRQTHAVRFMRPPFTKMKYKFTRKMFDEFKAIYTFLYRDNLRKQWREDEFSLLPLDVARRRQHRLDVQKKKKKKRILPADPTSYEQADMAEARSVPESAFCDPSLLWEAGNGNLERYVPPVIREKVKTRKQGTNPEESTEPAGDDPSVDEAVPQKGGDVVQRPLDQLKKSDVVTRDLLWRKTKGTLKWSDLVQFLSRLGCHLQPQDGSKRKIIDPLTGRWTLLHRPHPGDECRPDQRESYRIHVEDWLNIKYPDLKALDDMWETK